MRRHILAKYTLIMLLFATPAIGSELFSQITVLKLTKTQFLQLHEKGMDIVQYGENTLEIIAGPSDLEWLNEQAIPYRTDIEDLKDHYKSRNKAQMTMGGFRTLSEIEAYLDTLTTAYPALTTPKFSLGTSLEGRDIWAVKVSDNPGIDEDEPEVLYISLIHAREPAGAASLLNFMNHMLSNYGIDPEITDLVDNRELYFVPVQNPDGYWWNEFTDPFGGGMWRKNRRVNPDNSRGVDLNRNYGHQWGYDELGSSSDFTSTTYRGSGPFSEPETAAIRDFVTSRNFVIIHNFHCYSNLELWPPGFDRVFSPFQDFFQNLGDSMTMFNGYTPSIGWELYPVNGDADDWAWGDTISKPAVISLTCEIGGPSDGFWPDPFNIPGLLSENIWPNLFLARIADDPFVLGPPMAPIARAPDTIVLSNYTVSWSADDTLNPAVSYKLLELTDKQKVIDDVENTINFWETARFNRSNARGHSGLSSWHEQSRNRSHHWLLSQTPYEVQQDDTLAFWIWYDIEADWDYFYAQISTDGGFGFVNLANNLTTNSDPNGNNLGNGITGSSGAWIEARFDLSAYAGEQVSFRLAYFTDSWVLGQGVFIDDIQNVEFFGSKSEVATGIIDSFYTFTNVPSGKYWYRLTALDAEGQESRLSNIVQVEALQKGDANVDGDVNILDLTFLVDYVFRGGPPPDPFLAGDANCDDDTNLLDLTFMVDYVFRGGPFPNCTP